MSEVVWTFQHHLQGSPSWPYDILARTPLFLPDGEHLLVSCLEKTRQMSSSIQIWNWRSRECVRTIENALVGSGRVVVASENEVVVGDSHGGGYVRVWNWRTGECVQTFMLQPDGCHVYRIVVLPSGDFVVGHTEGLLICWRSSGLHSPFEDSIGPHSALSLSPDGKRIAAGVERFLHFFSVEGSQVEQLEYSTKFFDQTSSIYNLSYLPDGNLVILFDWNIRVVSETGECLHFLERGRSHQVAVFSDSYFVTGENQVKVWHRDSKKCIQVFQPSACVKPSCPGQLTGVDVHPEGFVVGTCRDGTVTVWRTIVQDWRRCCQLLFLGRLKSQRIESEPHLLQDVPACLLRVVAKFWLPPESTSP
eukprot:GILI01023647.1.p1 GENE.GILI01023647.1~~GILI01023647.1.p1  ORF type:complete len:363 (+),score=24.19 GILI01023647.1:76-1164(+)